MNGTQTLKLFLSISLGLHLSAFFLLSILLPEFKIHQLPPLNIEVSLLPLIRETGEDQNPVGNGLKPFPTGVRSREDESFNAVEKREEEIKSEPPITSQEEKGGFQVEKVEVTLPQKEQEPVSFPMVQSESRVVSVSEPKPIPLESGKKGGESKKEEKVVIASLGNPIPPQSSSETSQVTMKSPSLSESEITIPKPKDSENPKPIYPQEARKKGYEGEVLLKVMVLSNGRVGGIELKRSSGHKILDHSAMAAVKQWQFVPAQKGDDQVSFWVNIPVKFQLR